jgi:hypothetical protein
MLDFNIFAFSKAILPIPACDKNKRFTSSCNNVILQFHALLPLCDLKHTCIQGRERERERGGSKVANLKTLFWEQNQHANLFM